MNKNDKQSPVKTVLKGLTFSKEEQEDMKKFYFKRAIFKTLGAFLIGIITIIVLVILSSLGIIS